MRLSLAAIVLLFSVSQAKANLTLEMIDGICGAEAAFVNYGFTAAAEKRDAMTVWRDDLEERARTMEMEARLLTLFKKGYAAWPDNSVSEKQFSECAERIEQCGNVEACMYGNP